MPTQESQRIPDWAAITAVLGLLATVFCCIAYCLTDNPFAILGVSVSLGAVAIGFRGAERALKGNG